MCGLSTIYCCYTVDDEPVDTEIPDQWPPVALPVPDALRAANLNCASGNCTEAAPAPAQPGPPAAAPSTKQGMRMCSFTVLSYKYARGGLTNEFMCICMPPLQHCDKPAARLLQPRCNVLQHCC